MLVLFINQEKLVKHLEDKEGEKKFDNSLTTTEWNRTITHDKNNNEDIHTFHTCEIYKIMDVAKKHYIN